MQNITNKRLAVVLLGMYGALFIFLSSTSPQNIPAAVLLLPLVWLFMSLTGTGLLILRLVQPHKSEEDLRKQLGYASIGAAVPIGMLLLRSIDQLTTKDVILIVLLSAIGLFYLGRFKFAQKIE